MKQHVQTRVLQIHVMKVEHAQIHLQGHILVVAAPLDIVGQIVQQVMKICKRLKDILEYKKKEEFFVL